MNNPSKKSPLFILLVIFLILIIPAFANTLYLYLNAVSIGNGLGSNTGSSVGKAVGSYDGLTDGSEDGKKSGLSAEDTKADIATQLQQVQKLEVLVASVKLKDVHTVGKEDYAALYLANGNVVFTVDMDKADITSNSGKLRILLPSPVGELYIDDSSIKKAAENQKHIFSGSAEDGFDAYLNTMKKVQEASDDTLSNYDVLLDSAKQAAKRQITLLAQAASSSYETITVEFKE